jgi:glutathione synthase/RimK-type ligase-like ATP-grasp enzyme
MARIRILPYKQGSRSAKAIADALGGKVLKLEGSKYIRKQDDVVINWGNSNAPVGLGSVLNMPALVELASNKLIFFQAVPADVIPPFWTTIEDIPDDVFEKDGMVVCRTILSGHSGAGIVLADARASLVNARLYVKYIKKQDEYRVHVGRNPNGETNVISLQRKARRADVDNPNWQVRNHQNGFVYVRNNVLPPADVLRVAFKAFDATGLDFGAVDVIWNERQQKAYVLEINTAPGMEGQTIEDYARFFKEYI